MPQLVVVMFLAGLVGVALGISRRTQLVGVVAENQIGQGTVGREHGELDLVIGQEKGGNFLETGFLEKAGIGRLGERSGGETKKSDRQRAHASAIIGGYLWSGFRPAAGFSPIPFTQRVCRHCAESTSSGPFSAVGQSPGRASKWPAVRYRGRLLKLSHYRRHLPPARTHVAPSANDGQVR